MQQSNKCNNQTNATIKQMKQSNKRINQTNNSVAVARKCDNVRGAQANKLQKLEDALVEQMLTSAKHAQL